MASRQRKYNSKSRPIGTRRIKVLFLISVEGAVTEQQYFKKFNDDNSIIKIACINNNSRSSPKDVLNELKKKLKKTELRKGDEAWLVIDKDQWSDGQLTELYKWTEEKSNYYFALSNPNFEYWLLLHFEDPSGHKTARECKEKLKRYLPNYNKSIPISRFTEDRIRAAVKRAEQQDVPQCKDWPKNPGTTVYRLINHIHEARAKHLNGS
jgi:hypothetical protein